MQTKKQWLDFALYAVLIIVLAALALYAYLGSFTRYMADDYCTAAVLKEGGIWRAQSYWWNNWSGRYSFTFLVSLVELLGLRIVPILPGLFILLWLVSAVWALQPFLRDLQLRKPAATGTLIAAVLLWMIYRSVDDYPQIVFWQTGILTYPPSIILFLLGTGLAVRRAFSAGRLTMLELFLWVLFTFIAGGFSETGVVVQMALLALIFLLVNIGNTPMRKLSSILMAAFLGSIVSLLVIAVAPGNSVRPGGLEEMAPLSGSLPGLILETLIFVPRLIDQHTFTVAFGFLTGVFVLYFCYPDHTLVENRIIARHFAVSLLVAEVGILASIAPAYLLRVALPPERVLLSAYFLTAGLAIYWGVLSALLLKLNLPRGILVYQQVLTLGILIFFIVWGVRPVIASQLQLVPVLEQYATMWDQRHQLIVSASRNQESIVISDFTRDESLSDLGPKLWLSGDFETDPDFWINRCGARYYGAGQIVAE